MNLTQLHKQFGTQEKCIAYIEKTSRYHYLRSSEKNYCPEFLYACIMSFTN